MPLVLTDPTTPRGYKLVASVQSSSEKHQQQPTVWILKKTINRNGKFTIPDTFAFTSKLAMNLRCERIRADPSVATIGTWKEVEPDLWIGRLMHPQVTDKYLEQVYLQAIQVPLDPK